MPQFPMQHLIYIVPDKRKESTSTLDKFNLYPLCKKLNGQNVKISECKNQNIVHFASIQPFLVPQYSTIWI